MNNNVTKNKLEDLILQTIKSGSLNKDNLPKQICSNFKSNVLSINKKSFDIWNVFFQKSSHLDSKTLDIINRFYTFIYNLPEDDTYLYLNCTSLLNSYLDICLDDNSNYISVVY